MFWSVVVAGVLAQVPVDREERPVPPPKSMYQQIIVRTTGSNGYEEYVRAADMIQQLSNKSRIMSYDWPVEPGQPAPPYLQVRRDVVSKTQGILDLVRAGNRKPVFEPREKLDAATLFPEFAQFKNLAKLFTVESYVRYASGNPLGGLGSILDGLTFSHKMSQTTVISALVSIACHNIVLSSASDRLSQMSEAEAQRIIAFTDELMKQPNPVVKAIEGEREFIKSSLDSLIKEPKRLAGWSMDNDDDAELEQRTAELAALSAQQKASLLRSLGQRLDDRYTELLKQFSSPPAKWEGVETSAVATPKNALLEDFLFQMLEPGFLKQAFIASARQQTQLALFRAHAVIIRFRWHNNRLPARLEELGTAEYMKDPLSDELFVYEHKGNGMYELYSKGYKSTGPIHLRYQRPPGLGSGGRDMEPPGS